jgi:spore maturation protein CgeB
MTLNNNIGVERISEFSKKFSVISTYLGYKKFQAEKVRVLFLNSSGWIVSEVLQALKNNNCNVEVINVSHLNPENKNLTLDDYLHFHKELIKKLIEFKPDCILTINHAAFDSIGLLSKILEQFKMPFISWFVDSPLYIFKNAEPQKSNYLYLFLWEKSYVERLIELGFSHVFYLPLASGHESLAITPITAQERELYNCDVAFVGNSNKENTTDWFNKEYTSPKIIELTNEAVKFQIKNPDVEMRHILHDLDTANLLDKFDSETKLQFEAYCTLKATELFRNKVVKMLSENFNLKIFGDERWKENYSKNYCRKLDYYKDLPKLYKNAKIIVNVTSFQMNSAVNQRVFDVFFAGGFMISDYRSDYDGLFGTNVVPVYKSIDELQNLVKFYLNQEQERKKISEIIREIVTKNHLYSMRISELFSTVKMNYHE